MCHLSAWHNEIHELTVEPYSKHMMARVIQIYLGNFKHDNFTSATKFSCSLSQKQSITGKNFEIGLHLGLVYARQIFST